MNNNKVILEDTDKVRGICKKQRNNLDFQITTVGGEVILACDVSFLQANLFCTALCSVLMSLCSDKFT